MEGMRGVHILLGLSALLFFAGSWWLAITDPTECNYVLTAKEMLLADDYISPRIYGTFWFDKPVFFYWELIAAFRLFGFHEFAARFFPALFATMGVLLTCFFGSRLYGRKVGVFAGVILATSLEYWYIAHAIITDMTLFTAMSAALICFYLGYSEGKGWLIYPAFAAAGIAVLTKGPIGICLPGLIILLFLLWQRDLKWLLRMECLKGAILFLAVVSVWYLPMMRMHGMDFVNSFLGVHNVLRATVPEHPEVDVWYYYLAVFFVGCLPWNLAAVPDFIRRLCRREIPSPDMRTRFLLVWAITVPVVFQCFATKYVTYTLPYMLPLAILFAVCFSGREKLFQRIAAGTAVVYLLVLLLVAVPACEENSGKSAAEELAAGEWQDACVAIYRKSYSASLVFYSGREVIRLEPDRETTNALQPGGISWNNNNIMPLLAMEDLPQDKRVIVFVDAEKEQDFLQRAKGSWQRVKQVPKGNLIIYQRDPYLVDWEEYRISYPAEKDRKDILPLDPSGQWGDEGMNPLKR